MTSLRSGSYKPVPGGFPACTRATVDALCRSATREVLIMSTGVETGPITALGHVDHNNLRRGIRYRVLLPDSARLARKLSRISLAGADVRTDADVPAEAMVIDGRTAMLPAERNAERSANVVVIWLPSVIAATMGLFEQLWQAAVPLAPLELPDEAFASALTYRERALLALLTSGNTDESAAARLGVSVRTVRRMVADIMNRLGARSRFQAGAKAAKQGWLMDMAR